MHFVYDQVQGNDTLHESFLKVFTLLRFRV